MRCCVSLFWLYACSTTELGFADHHGQTQSWDHGEPVEVNHRLLQEIVLLRRELEKHNITAPCMNNITLMEAETNEELLRLMPKFLLGALIITLVLTQMGLTFMTNWKDASIRYYAYRTINTTVSIFLAVLLNRLILDVFLLWMFPCFHILGAGRDHEHGENSEHDIFAEGFGHGSVYEVDKGADYSGHPCGHAKHWQEVCLAAIWFVIYFVVLNFIMIKIRDDEKSRRQFMTSSIGGHLIAFAGIETFGNWQYRYICEANQHGSWTTTLMGLIPGVVACVVFTIFRFFSARVRDCFADSTYIGLKGDLDRHNGDVCCSLCHRRKKKDDWEKLTEEAEDDANALCLGFLAVQWMTTVVLHTCLPVEGDHKLVKDDERNTFKKFYLVVMLVLILFVCFRVAVRERLKGTGWKRFVKNLQQFIGMVFAWSVFRHGDWFWREMFNDVLRGKEWANYEHSPPLVIHLIARVVNANFITIGCGIFLFIMVFCVDIIQERYRDHYEGCCAALKKVLWSKFGISDEESIKVMFEDLSHKVEVSEVREAEKKHRRIQPDSELTSLSRPMSRQSDISIHRTLSKDELNHADNLTRAIFDLTGVLGFLVGICWEKTFSAANMSAFIAFHDLVRTTDAVEIARQHHHVGPWMMWLGSHPLCTRLITCSLSMAIVAVVWWKYLVRLAQFDCVHHMYLLITQSFIRDAVERNISHTDVAHLEQFIKEIWDDKDGSGYSISSDEEDESLSSEANSKE